MVLIAVLVYIGVRSVQLSREWKGRSVAYAQQHDHAPAGAPQASSTQQASLLDTDPRLRALVYPPPPPERDPFYPVIPPRRGGAPARPAPSTETSAPKEPVPVVPAASTLSMAGADGLRVTGILLGNPSAAVLRIGEKHYVVRVGDWLDNQVRVHAIDKSTVTLREGKNSYVLRIGR